MKNTTDTGYEIAKWIGGAAAGALLMYMLDPDRGGARRAQSAAAVRNAGARTSSALGNVWRGAGERIGAAGDELRDRAADVADGAGARSGSALERMGHAASEVLDAGLDKAKDTLARASDAVGSGMDKARHALGGNEAGNGMDKARAMAHDVRTRMRDTLQTGPGGEWTPTVRNSALAGGGLLALYALSRRSPLAWMLGLAGAALLARGAANQPLLPMLRGRGMGMDQTVDFSKSIHIDAAPDDVYDLWTHYENFPHFMSHVVEVRDLGRGRSHWVVRGPGGSEFEWNAVLTEQTRPHRLAWRSEAGAEIPQSGSIQFEPHRGGTRVTVHMSYTPPAGAIGHGLATLLGSDPKSQMDDDLARMKAFIERGAVPRDAARPRSSSRWLH
ncbi:SRPBCC family protein [Telluria mixta]|uniref:SRPBCC family protein n=1 Tax=Telluria mixta TaxID=34071 RepID=A0ABT2BSF1_9BURK|nr:SRPBCC family protein [Telluria mixta]MCS0627981.1 SRPBCC family protein [Telluria mixta]WEM93900.1 SRPBCC family protein [Telluria mixta]